MSEISHIAALFNPSIHEKFVSLLEDFPWESEIAIKLTEVNTNFPELSKPELISALTDILIDSELNKFLELVQEFKNVDSKKEVESISDNIFKFYKIRKTNDTISQYSDDITELLLKLKEIPLDLASKLEAVTVGQLDPATVLEEDIGGADNILPTNFKLIKEATPFNGYLPGQVIQWLAAPGVGKSAAMLYEVLLMALHGYNILWCFSGDTEVLLPDDTSRTLEDLFNNNITNFEIISTDLLGNPCIETAERVAITGYTSNMLEIEVEDRIIKCTPDHLFLLTSGEYKKAKDLEINDDLMDVTIDINKSRFRESPAEKAYKQVSPGYKSVSTNTGFIHEIHRLLAMLISKEYYYGSKLIAHHIDENIFNNTKSNIKIMSNSDHMSYHMKERMKDDEFSELAKQNMIKNWDSEEFRLQHSKRVTERNKINWQDDEYRKKMLKTLKDGNSKLWTNADYLELFSKTMAKCQQDWYLSNILIWSSYLYNTYKDLNTVIWDNNRLEISNIFDVYISKVVKSDTVIYYYESFDNIIEVLNNG